MTAKEALLQRVGRLSEEEAAAWLVVLQLEDDPLLLGEPDLAALDALIERKQQHGPSMTDEQWEALVYSLGTEHPAAEQAP